MNSILKSILGLFILLFITGCMKVIEIEGSKEIQTNESKTYKAVIVTPKLSSMDSYKWKVLSDNKDYTLTGESTSEVVFKASTAGIYTLKVIAKKYRKPFKATIKIVVTEPEIINGYLLPPEPDEILNNSTFLGIDSNDNGVRDDVEIYVIKRYAQDPDFPKTKTALAMQYAWAEQKIIDNPTLENVKYQDDAIDCEFYFLKQKTKDMTSLDGLRYHTQHEVFNDSKINDKIYNTRERIKQSFKFNQACSGNIFDGRRESIENCQVNIDELGE